MTMCVISSPNFTHEKETNMNLKLISTLVLSVLLVACNSNARLSDANGKKITSPVSANDGSTDDGSTDDGSTDDGSTDDGSTDDGSTDDGSTDEPAPKKDGYVDLSDVVSDKAISALNKKLYKVSTYSTSFRKFLINESVNTSVNKALVEGGSNISDIRISGDNEVTYFKVNGSEDYIFVTSEMKKDCKTLKGKRGLFGIKKDCTLEQMIDYINCDIKPEFLEVSEKNAAKANAEVAKRKNRRMGYKKATIANHVAKTFSYSRYAKIEKTQDCETAERAFETSLDVLARDLNVDFTNTSFDVMTNETGSFNTVHVAGVLNGSTVSETFDTEMDMALVEYITDMLLNNM